MNKPLRTAQAFGPPPVLEARAEPPRKAESPKPAAEQSEKNAMMEQLDEGGSLNIQQVMQILPHRYPFLMVDGVMKSEGNKITAFKNVTINEPYFQGHFPGHPIMPGVLQLEAVAQVAGILMLRRAENLGQLAYFMSAEEVKWRKPVFPGDVLVIEVELIKSRGKIGKAKGICKVRDEVVSEAEVTFMLRGQ
jgi:UDP-3-O-[3-hydroxymyristoyl] N-acetylglucosamine deacetylase/3-hydroxyacyl-[acyl-carrier-protein] dehydratase